MRISDWSSDVCSSEREDLAAGSIVQGPARLLLLLTVHRAGEYVQTRWVESIVEPLAKLPASEQIATLYGEQGKLDAFVNDWLKPFVTEKERMPVKVAGISMPLAPAFQGVVGAERQFLPVRSEEHTSELQSLMRISYAVFCLKKKKKKDKTQNNMKQ